MKRCARVLLLFAVCLTPWGCPKSTPPKSQDATAIPAETLADSTSPRRGEPSAPVAPASRGAGRMTVFHDAAAEAGLSFEYLNGESGRELMVESTGGGGGWLDYDRDGWPDLMLVQGGDPLATPSDPRGDRIYRSRAGRFVDVTDATFRTDAGYGQGLAAGDFDNDGFPDLLITNVGPDVLLHNLGDGTFEDATRRTGLGDPRWGTSAAWGDLDGDGDLDLVVCNYLKYDVRHPVVCRSASGRLSVCHPEELPADDNECYENLGDGTFRPISRLWGLHALDGKSLGVVIADLAGDSRPDVFIANDTTANHLFVQVGPGRFEERGVELGCALSGQGTFQANMGVAYGDYDRNGRPDLYVTHFTDESNTLYANLGESGFADVTQQEGLHRPTLPYLGFGTVMCDFDADGREELFIANGHIDNWEERGEMWYMPPQLFRYDGGRWSETTAQAGPYFGGRYLGRAVSTADFDRDGDMDLLVVHQNAPAALLRNDSPRGAVLQVELQGVTAPRDGTGARVEVRTPSGTLVQQLAGGTSYCAAHEPMLLYGLDREAECDVEVIWSETDRQSFSAIASDQRITVRQGTSLCVATCPFPSRERADDRAP